MDKVLGFLKNLAKAYGSKLVLFGSRARGNFTNTSDYDIAFFEINNDLDKIKIRYTCEHEAPTLCKIDVHFAEEMSEKLFANMEKEGIIIYELTGN